MGRYIYCKNGESRPIITCTKKEVLNGFVVMKEEPLSSLYICKDNQDGTGEWIIPKRKYSKKAKFFFKKRKKLIYLLKAINFLKSSYNKFIFKIPNKYLYSITYFFGYLKNLFTPNDINKQVTYSIFIFSLIGIAVFENTIQNVFISIIAAPFFNLFISLIPRENKKIKKAIRYGKLIGLLSELKNSQYINIGYLTNTFSDEHMYDKKIDVAMNREKAVKIYELLVAKRTDKVLYLPEFIKLEYFKYADKSTIGYFNFAHEFFKNKAKLLMQVDDDDLFLGLNDALMKIHEINSEEIRPFNTFNMSSPMEIGEYITKQFVFIEYLEYWYMKECLPYSKFYYGYDNYLLTYDDDFIINASNIRSFSYF